MISEKMQKALNEQINWELYSAYLYLSMSSHFLSANLGGFANWMRVQAQEELFHAIKFYDFVHQRGGKSLLQPVKAPPSDWNAPLAAFEAVLKHEQHVSKRINDLASMAVKEKDHATSIFLQWFVTEQVEEEASVIEVVQKLKLIGDAGGGLFMLDRELAQRVFTMPATGAEKA